MGSGVKRWESTLQGKREKSFGRHTHFCDELSHTRDVLGREKSHFSMPLLLELRLISRWQYGIRIRRGWKRTARIHPSLTLFHPLLQKVSTLNSKRDVLEKKHARGGIWEKRESGDKSAHGQAEGNRACRENFYLDKSSSTNDFILFTYNTAIVINISPRLFQTIIKFVTVSYTYRTAITTFVWCKGQDIIFKIWDYSMQAKFLIIFNML
jgi:hypothetical protein